MQPFEFAMTALSWRGGAISYFVIAFVLAYICYQLQRYEKRHARLVKETGRQVYGIVANHIASGYAQARPRDIPGADPDTKMVRFWQEPDGSIVIERIDWKSPVKKQYVIGSSGTIRRRLARHSSVRLKLRDYRWQHRSLTRKPRERLKNAVNSGYLLARSRDTDDTPRRHDFVPSH